jgi:hypothetical protein
LEYAAVAVTSTVAPGAVAVAIPSLPVLPLSRAGAGRHDPVQICCQPPAGAAIGPLSSPVVAVPAGGSQHTSTGSCPPAVALDKGKTGSEGMATATAAA